MIDGYVEVDEHGFVLHYAIAASTPEGAISPPAVNDPSELFDHAYYFDGSKWHSAGKSPSEEHTLDRAAKRWLPPNIEHLRAKKRHEINRDRDAFEFGGFDWSGYRFDSNAISQQRIQGSAQLAMVAQAAGQPFSIEWTLADNSVITLDGDQMLAVGLAMGQHIQAAHSKSRLLKQQIDQAQSKEELESITW